MKNILDMFYQKVSHSFSKISDMFHYYNAASKKMYLCQLLDGYSFADDGSVELKIKQFGRGGLIIIKVNDLFENEHLMSALSPYDVAKISFIAVGEHFYKFPNEDKEAVFKRFLSKIQKGD